MCSQLTTEQRPRLNERASEAVEDEGAAATATSVAVDEETLRVSAAPFPPPTFSVVKRRQRYPRSSSA